MSLGQLAGVEHVAARVDDRVERRALTGQRRRHRLVDQREPAGGVALADPDQAELGQGDQLEIDVAGGLAPPRGPARSAPRRRRGPSSGRPRATHSPAVQRPGLERLEQPLRPADPTVGGREVGEVRLVGDRQPHRAPRRARASPPRGTARRPGVHRSTQARFSPSHHRATASPKHASAVSPSARPPRTPPGHRPTGPRPGRRSPLRPARRSSRRHCRPYPARHGSEEPRDQRRVTPDPEPSVHIVGRIPQWGSGIEQGLPRCRRIEVRPTVARVRMVNEPTPSTSGGWVRHVRPGGRVDCRRRGRIAAQELPAAEGWEGPSTRRAGAVRACRGRLRVPRSQRIREDHHDPLPPRSGSPHLRPVPGAGRGLARPPARRRRAASGALVEAPGLNPGLSAARRSPSSPRQPDSVATPSTPTSSGWISRSGRTISCAATRSACGSGSGSGSHS